MPSVVCRIVEIVIFKRVKAAPRYLILKRAARQKLYPGIWQVVSGKVRRGEGAIAAARREVREETRLSIKRFWVAPFVVSFFNPTSDTLEMSPLFAGEVAAGAQPRLSREHQSFRWMSFTEARRLLVWPDDREGLEIIHRYIVGRKNVSRLTELRN